MQGTYVVARLIHVFSGVFWAGSVLFINLLLAPSVGAAGAPGIMVMRQLSERKYHQTVEGFAYLTVLSGFYLVWLHTRGMGGAWFGTGMGMGISIGMTAALISLVLGVAVVRPAIRQMLALAAEADAAGPDARPAVFARMLPVRSRLKGAGVANVLLLTTAILAMAVARGL